MAISYLAEVGITSDLVLYGVRPEDAWHCWPDWLPKIYFWGLSGRLVVAGDHLQLCTGHVRAVERNRSCDLEVHAGGGGGTICRKSGSL